MKRKCVRKIEKEKGNDNKIKNSIRNRFLIRRTYACVYVCI